MYKSPSKRSMVLRRTAVYSLMTIIVISVVSLLVLVMLGYRFDRNTSTIQQGGLVQFASLPTGANVKIGVANLANLTPSKITMNPGQYDVLMTKRGYKDWSKNVDVKSGQVLWLNYAKLLPQEISTTELTTYESIADVRSAPNGERFAVIQQADRPTITIIDITGSSPRSSDLQIPESILPTDTNKEVTYDINSWSFDSRQLLVTATMGKRVEWLLINRSSPEESVNLSDTYDSDIREAKPDPRGSERVVYVSNSGQLRSIDTGSDSLSQVLANDVERFTYYDDDAILYVQGTTAGEKVVSYRSFGKERSRELKRVATEDRVFADMATYFGDPFLMTTSGNKLIVEKLRELPASDSDSPISMNTVTEKELSSVPTFANLRSSGRFATAQYPGGVDTYDMELDKHTVTTLTDANEELRWYDRYHFYVTDGANLRISEFDGGNPGVIAPLTTRFDSVMTSNGKFVYSFDRKDDGSFVLKRSQVILD